MKLSAFERLCLLSILPKEGSFITLKILRNLQNSLSFDEEEIKAVNFREDPIRGTATLNTSVNIDKDVEIGERAMDLIVDGLKRLDKEGKLTIQLYDLYERFVGKEV